MNGMGGRRTERWSRRAEVENRKSPATRTLPALPCPVDSAASELSFPDHRSPFNVHIHLRLAVRAIAYFLAVPLDPEFAGRLELRAFTPRTDQHFVRPRRFE